MNEKWGAMKLNRLPKDIISADDVKVLQRNLQIILKQRILSGYEDYKNIISPRIPECRHPPQWHIIAVYVHSAALPPRSCCSV